MIAGRCVLNSLNGMKNEICHKSSLRLMESVCGYSSCQKALSNIACCAEKKTLYKLLFLRNLTLHIRQLFLLIKNT